MHTIWKKTAAAASAAVLGLTLFGCSSATSAADESPAPAESAAAAESTSSADKAREHRRDRSTETAGSAAAAAEVPTQTDFSAKDLTDTWPAGAAEITLRGDSIEADHADVQIDGTTASVTAAGSYVISGTLDNGQIVVDAGDQDDVQLVLNGADITCSDGPAISVVGADKVILTLASGTDNHVTDGAVYTDTSDTAPKGAVYAEEDLSVNGTGSLTVTAQNNNGIHTKDDLKIIDGTITVTAPNHAIVGKDSVSIGGGSFTLEAGGDGIQSDQDSDPSKGWIVIDDGSFTITAGGDGIQAETGLTVHGGSFTVTTGGGAENGEVHTSQDRFGGGFGRPDDSFGGFAADGDAGPFGRPDDSFGGFGADGDAGPFGRPDDSFGGFGASEDDFGGFSPADDAGAQRPGRHHGRDRSQQAAADDGYAADAATLPAAVNLSLSPSPSADSSDQETETDPSAAATDERSRRERPDAVTAATEQRSGSGRSGAPTDASGSSATSGTSSKGLKAGGTLKIAGGTFDLNCSDDGVHSNSDIGLEGGKFRIASGDDAVHADGSLVVRADIEITESYEGLEGLSVSLEDGTINLKSSDDGVNAAGDAGRASVSISGGVLKAECGGDGIDSNGGITVSGGDIEVLIRSSADNCAIDVEGEFTVTGGSLVYGGTGTGSGPQSGSSQSYVYASGSFHAGETVSLRQNGQELMRVTPDIDCSSLIFSQPGIEAGASYEVYSGSTLVATAQAGQGGSGMTGGGRGFARGAADLQPAEPGATSDDTASGSANTRGARPYGSRGSRAAATDAAQAQGAAPEASADASPAV